jgi:hypothetical protein
MEHVMVRIDTNGDVDKWYCPICGRKFWLSRMTARITVITPGDENVCHTGGQGVTMVPPVVVQDDETTPELAEWLKSKGME